jgi:hypothetical protein
VVVSDARWGCGLGALAFRASGSEVPGRLVITKLSLHLRRRGLVVLPTRTPPSRRRRGVRRSGTCVRQRARVLTVTVDSSVLEPSWRLGGLHCPGCGGRLAAWGIAREREVRMLDGVRSLRPRRACCRECEKTHVLLPGWSVPRRRDGAEVIGAALLHKARGAGHRSQSHDRGAAWAPAGTVRGWLRAFARWPRRSAAQPDAGRTRST